MVAILIPITVIYCTMFFSTLPTICQGTAAKSPSTLIANLALNQRTLELTWNSSVEDANYTCYLKPLQSTHFIQKRVAGKSCLGIGIAKPIHKGASYNVQTTYNGTVYLEEGTFTPQGMNGTSVENFSCVIYDVSFMNCTWNVGRNAPEDTQYFLSVHYSKEEELQCPHYTKDALGRPITCTFQDVKIDTENVYFRVTGSSNISEIQFYDAYIELYEIEKLTPPLNITVNCSEVSSECIVRWKRPRLSHLNGNIDHCFEYQINIQNKETNASLTDMTNGSPEEDVTFYKIENVNVKKTHILQIRARGVDCLISSNWGEWSEPIEFGPLITETIKKTADSPSLQEVPQGIPSDEVLTIGIVLLIILLGTLLLALVIFFLCSRYCSLKTLFPPVPQPKNKFNVFLQLPDKNTQEGWVDLPPTKYEAEEITTIEATK